jgi:hypothetical protein
VIEEVEVRAVGVWTGVSRPRKVIEKVLPF